MHIYILRVIFPKHLEQKQPASFHLISLVFQLIVDDVSLSHSSLPNEGFVKLLTKYSGNQSVCWESLKNSADDVVCRQLGYKRSVSPVKQPAPSDVKDEIFSGSINCDGEENYLSQCAIDASTKSCSELSYINCKFFKFDVLQYIFSGLMPL